MNSYRAVFSFFIITLRRPINPIGFADFTFCSLGPLCTVSLQHLLTAGSLFVFFA
jgi:hypothetical protein